MGRAIAIIGGGPVGLYAAFAAVSRGHDVTLFERADVGDSISRWDPIRLFSPLGMNVPRDVRDVLQLTDDDALLTGAELRHHVLQPLASHPSIAARIRRQTAVLSVGRRGMTRGDFAAHPLRSDRPFRLILEHQGEESAFDAEVVIDATGGYVVPNPVGHGGLACPGERRAGSRIIRHLRDLHRFLPEAAGRSLLLAGNGHSAANALAWLAPLLERHEVEVTWAVRTANRRPCVELAGDPLPERERVVGIANALAESPPPGLRVERRAGIERMVAGDDAVEVAFTGERTGRFHRILAFTGFRPDQTPVRELQLDLSPATDGVARLWRRLTTATDCLSIPRAQAADLQTGEPGYWMIGSRSYGRAATFLLRNGIEQIETVLAEVER